MTSFPALSYVCPIRWDTMRGDERERYCSKCSHTVVNISLLTSAEREALLANPPPGGLCVAYYQRLSGEYVSAEQPLTAGESRRVVQWGAIAASVATLAAAAQFAPEISAGTAAGVSQVAKVCNHLNEQGKEALYKCGIMQRPAPPVHLIMGMTFCPAPSPIPAAPAPIPAATTGSTTASTSAPAPTPLPAEHKI